MVADGQLVRGGRMGFGGIVRVMLEPGSIVRGNWSRIEYRVDHAWSPSGKDYWCINGKAVDNKLSSGSFSMLGERVGNEVMITDPARPDDRLYILREKTRKPRQMELAI
tara:strand:+ start:64 stop:390 length:327 start_codon:yes stop_codon:yes gene_type:complete